ncbi:MAG TPA: glycosyltransferase, partial [Chitinophagaceae bacterium]
SHYPGTATIVRGLPSSSSIIPSTGMIKFYNHLPSGELNDEFQKAEWVISRSGYSTVMDIVKLRKKSILVPTPGQTEQKYLAKYLQQRQLAFTIDQDKFALIRMLDEARKFDYKLIELPNSNELSKAVKEFLKTLSKY